MNPPRCPIFPSGTYRGFAIPEKVFLEPGDNLTKVYKTHTIKVGYYMDETGNSNVTLGSQVNGNLTIARWDSCNPNQVNPNAPGAPPASPGPSGAPSTSASMYNTVGNFLMGCLGGYGQDNGDPIGNVRFRPSSGTAPMSGR